MSTPRGFGLNGKSYYTNVSKPQDVNLTFTVAATNGLGITSLKSNGYVRNVFMHTSTTPTANDGYTNPNPAAGYALVQFQNNFNYYLSNFVSINSPNSGSDVKIDNSALTIGRAYTITTLGNSTAAAWAAIGVPVGVTPAVGVSFIATAVGAGANTSTSRVQAPSVSGVYAVEAVGNPNMSYTSNIGSNGGAWAMLQFLAPVFTAGAYTPAGTVSAPTFTGTVLGNHNHTLNLKNAAVSDGATTSVNAGTNLLGANTGSDITIAGGGANGGIADASAGTPAGTNSAPTFTGTASSLTGTLAMAVVAPAAGSIISVTFKYDASSVTIDGI